ncbi:hypothetical protein [Variovorax sp. PAMC26660]|uniref:hypothetical protein n=1 Tax=Variovorax sp. PAMC26660 TaxID=2762322 RepID=UPI00164E10CD|nr:hypothetical protein [Variovorax sp. PAMC26660]QNK67836.1 hypothetical protein H7F35_32720 [Variovorax sp. PAMC26660]
MMQGTLGELSLTGVFDRGIPNAERIVIRVNEHVDMASYVLMQGLANGGGGAVPIRDAMFWFGNGLLEPNDWIFVYTAAGEPRSLDLPLNDGSNGTHKLVMLHWSRTQTMFHAPNMVPILARIDALLTNLPALPPVPGLGVLSGVFNRNTPDSG